MKQVLLFSSLILSSFLIRAQSFNFQLTGNPVNTTGWTVGTQSFVEADALVLTNNISNQAGYIYYSTPQNLTNCSQFTVSFEFRITNSSAPTADGIAFWYITNPPTGFTGGGGIGMPNNPNGLLLILDTYDNNSVPNNPLVSLRKLDGTSNYVEGSTTGQLTADLTGQNFITDGSWHTCVLTYYFGTVTVAFDGNPPVMTGTTTLGLNGYFGFSAGTGASWAKHAIRNVNITGAPEPAAPVGNDVTYCQGATAVPLTATGTNLSWFTAPTGGAALPGAPTPGTAVAGTFTWYVSQAVTGCNVESVRDTVTVTVNPKPAPPVIAVPKYCSGQTSVPLSVTTGTNVLWYTAPTGGTGDGTIPVINTAVADTFTWYATQTNTFGCESERVPVEVIIHQTPVPDFTYTLGYACDQDTVRFSNTTTYGGSYQWNFDDGYADTVTHPVHIYEGQNTYNVVLKASNSYCTDSVLKPVTISHPLQAAFTTSADTVCEGSTITFTNTSTATTIYGNDPQYYWNFDDGGSSILQHPTHSYTAPGIYQVMMVVKNAIPCSDTTYRTIYVDSVPHLSFTRSDTSVCRGQIVTFMGSYLQNGLENIQWNFGENTDLIANVNPAQHAFEHAGTYTITLYGNYRVCPDVSATTTLLVKPSPVVNLGPDTSLCLDGTALLLEDKINASDPKASWLWNTGATTAAIEARHDGVYSATVTIDQCSTTDEIVVVKDCIIDVPNSFTPNGDGVNDYFFPRQLLSNGVASFTMSIYNRWGQKIFETQKSNGRGWDGKFSEKEQPLGVYVYDIKVIMKNGRTEAYTGNVTLLR
jgi:gliding motility-associated-like protein